MVRKDPPMDDEPAATKRSPRKRQKPIDVAVLYNVDFEDARAMAAGEDPSRSSIVSVVNEVAAGLSLDGAHLVSCIAVDGDFVDLKARLDAQPPSCVFNLCESIAGDARLETALPTMLDLMGIPYTGSPPDALSAALYKDRVKQRLLSAGVPTPRGILMGSADDPCDLPFPLIVKPSREDGSAGIHSRSVVHDKASLRERVDEVIATFRAPGLVEEYIDGREMNVALLGYPQARVLPLQEIDFSGLPPDVPRIVSYDAKWATGSVEDLGTRPVMLPDLPAATAARARKAAVEAFRAIGVRDYGRVDLRLSAAGIPYVVDVNPNCDIGPDAGFARAAASVGIDYPALVRLLVRYALRRRKTAANDSGSAEARG
jgi:D-alanine-D-alanine ligase